MRVRLVIPIVLFFLFASLASGATTTIHEDWHAWQDSFVIDGVPYSIKLSSNSNDEILFKANDFGWILEQDSCVDNVDYTYCYDEHSYDEPEATIWVDGKLVPAIHITILKENADDPDVKVSHEYESNPTGNDKLVIRIENVGDRWANPIDYKLQIPDSITILKKNQLTLTNNILQVVTALPSGSEKEYEFEFKSSKIGTQEFKYNLSFKDSVSEKFTSGTYSPSIVGPYKITHSLSPSDVEINEQGELKINIENLRQDEKLNIDNIRIKGPINNVKYSSVKGLKWENQGIYKSIFDEILSLKNQDFILKVNSDKQGDYKFQVLIELESDGVFYKEEFNETLTVNAKGFISGFILTQDDVLSGEEIDISYALGNENDNLKFKNIHVDIESEFFEDTIDVEELSPVTPKSTIYLKRISVPFTADDASYDMLVTTTYQTSTGEEITFNETHTIKVTGQGDILGITQDIDKSSAMPGDEILVEVYIENLKDERFKTINVLEEFSRGAQLTFGESFKAVELIEREKRKAYTYKVKIPDKYYQESFNITSTAVIPNMGYKTSTTSTILVTPTPPEPIVGGDNSTVNGGLDIDVQTGSNGEEEKQSFLVGIVKSIENFFTKLFS